MTRQISDIINICNKKVRLVGSLAIPMHEPMVLEERPFRGLIDRDFDMFIGHSRACVRRYIATWEIKDNLLFLVEVRGMYKLKNGPVVADWFTGKLFISNEQARILVGIIGNNSKDTGLSIELSNGRVVNINHENIIDDNEVSENDSKETGEEYDETNIRQFLGLN